jgi:hypothetical protein
MTPYPRRQQLAIPASAIPAFAARYGMTVPELLAYHLEHGGRICDRTGAWLCWPLVDDEEADA